MKILLTGGGTGGHFYPIIAVAQSINSLAKEEKLVDVKLYYMAPQPYDKNALFENNVTFISGTSGKSRNYFSLLNYFDIFKTGFGVLSAIWKLYWLYPDVVFGKGGYVSFPALFAARFLRIPVVIHESDSHPGKVNMWAGRFARRIAVSYPEAAEHFKKEKVAYTGNPIRREILHTASDGAHEFLKLEPNIPVILILGGSQGSEKVNEAIVDSLSELVKKYQIIHQTGVNNLVAVQETGKVVLEKSQFKNRYKPFDYLNNLALRMAAGVADLVVSRAGSTIFELALWGIPSILIPIKESNGDHQRKNAYSYARTGAAEVIEENNLTPHVLISEIDRLMDATDLRAQMHAAAQKFARTDSADLIAQEILDIGLEHEE